MSECHRREAGLNIQHIHDDDDDGACIHLVAHGQRVWAHRGDIKNPQKCSPGDIKCPPSRKVIRDSITGERRQLIKLTNRRHSFPPRFFRIIFGFHDDDTARFRFALFFIKMHERERLETMIFIRTVTEGPESWEKITRNRPENKSTIYHASIITKALECIGFDGVVSKTVFFLFESGPFWNGFERIKESC